MAVPQLIPRLVPQLVRVESQEFPIPLVQPLPLAVCHLAVPLSSELRGNVRFVHNSAQGYHRLRSSETSDTPGESCPVDVTNKNPRCRKIPDGIDL